MSNPQLARGMLEIAQKRMLGTYPLHARFLARWQIGLTHAIPTMAVTVRSSTIWLLYNPDFVVSCSFDELAGVVHHEINHVLFQHVFMEPTAFPDEEALVIAQETSTNEWIPEPLPGAPILLSQFPQLPANEDAATRYRRLARARQDGPIWGRISALLGHKKGDTVPNSPSSGPNRASDGTLSGEPTDDHSVWAEARASGPIGRMAVGVRIREAVRSVTPDEWKKVSPMVRNRIRQLTQGNSPGSDCEALDGLRDGRLDWRRLLRRYVGLATEERPVFNRPPRRFPDLVGIVPGRRRQNGPPSIMAVIDTSASMTTEMLDAIAGELTRLAVAHRVTVVECDAAVQRVYPFDGRLTQMHGRGGTDLSPPFDRALLAKVNPIVIIYFTDGCGPAPDRPPRFPVVWCLTPGGCKPADWGRELWLPDGDDGQ